MPELITVSGMPGSGTTTLCKMLQERTGLPYVYAGQIFRDEAKRRDLSLSEFGELCQDDPRVDRSLDDRQIEVLKEAAEGDGVILEGRLSGWHAKEHAPGALKVWLHCKTSERIRRIMDRDGGDMAEQVQTTGQRERSEADRYQRYYGIDLSDTTPYDLVLDSTGRSPDELADDVMAALRSD